MKKKKKANAVDNNDFVQDQANRENIRFCPHCGNKLDGEDICPQCHQSVQ